MKSITYRGHLITVNRHEKLALKYQAIVGCNNRCEGFGGYGNTPEEAIADAKLLIDQGGTPGAREDGYIPISQETQ